MEMGGNSQGNDHELSASTFSSPLYSSQSVNIREDTSGGDQYAENGTLMDIIRMQSAKKRNHEVQSSSGGIMESAAPQTASNGAAAVPGVATKPVDPYKESVTFGGGDSRGADDQDDYEPIKTPPPSNFDDPDYEAV